MNEETKLAIEELKTRIDELEKKVFQVPLDFDAESKYLFQRHLAIPYTTSDPTAGANPSINGYRIIYNNAGTYRLYIWINGVWKYATLT